MSSANPLDGLFGVRRIVVDGEVVTLRPALEFLGDAPVEVTERQGTDELGNPILITSVTLPPGAPGEPGAPGASTDPADGDAGFTAGSTGVLLAELTLEAGKYYNVAYYGLNTNNTLTDGVRMRPFDISACVAVSAGGVASLQSPTVGQPQPLTGSGQIEFAVTGAKVQVYLYGGSADTEWFGTLKIVSEYDPLAQIPDNWTPASEASCLFALDPNVGCTVNGSNQITSWSGQIGVVAATASANHPTRVSSRSSLNNQPAALFTQASSQRLTFSGLASVAADYMFFAVLDVVSLDADSYLFDTQTGRLILSPDRSGGNIAYSDGSFKTAAGAATGAQKLGWILSSTGGNTARIRKNGADVNTGLSYTQTAIGGNTRMGSHYLGTSTYFDGYVGYFCAFSGVNEKIRFLAERYLQQRFGV